MDSPFVVGFEVSRRCVRRGWINSEPHVRDERRRKRDAFGSGDEFLAERTPVDDDRAFANPRTRSCACERMHRAASMSTSLGFE
jgi:hypothetical protein